MRPARLSPTRRSSARWSARWACRCGRRRSERLLQHWRWGAGLAAALSAAPCTRAVQLSRRAGHGVATRFPSGGGAGKRHAAAGRTSHAKPRVHHDVNTRPARQSLHLLIATRAPPRGRTKFARKGPLALFATLRSPSWGAVRACPPRCVRARRGFGCGRACFALRCATALAPPLTPRAPLSSAHGATV
jgi:hypothetical protein